MAIDDYSGSVDWDRIYSLFHAPDAAAARILHELGESDTALIAAGFSETAAILAETRPVLFADVSEQTVANAVSKYGHRLQTRVADVIGVIATRADVDIVLYGRLTAFWQTSADFARFAAALDTFPRRVVLIDFFDAETAVPGTKTVFSKGLHAGEWDTLEVLATGTSPLRPYRVRQRIRYDHDDSIVDYQTTRSYFRSSEVERWAAIRFAQATVAIRPPLIPNDPSFTLRISFQTA